MSDEPSPRPWRVNESIGGWRSCVSDANGNHVASCWGGGPTEQQEKAEAAAALIVDAVNERDELKADNLALANGVIENRDRARRLMYERDRLRDIVRRLLMLRRGDIAVPMDTEKQILADARAAIVEETK